MSEVHSQGSDQPTHQARQLRQAHFNVSLFPQCRATDVEYMDCGPQLGFLAVMKGSCNGGHPARPCLAATNPLAGKALYALGSADAGPI